MNVYDFDHTMYAGDTTIDFYIYCIKKQPKILAYLPRQVLGLLRYVFGSYDKTSFKQCFYLFLQGITDVDLTITSFWDTHIKKIKPWYLEKHHSDDVVISASPEFLLWEVCRKLGIRNLIASRVDKYTGIYSGLNCYGEEKLARFRKEYPNQSINEFYSDSLSDIPLGKISKNFFVIKGNTPIALADYQRRRLKKLESHFFTKEFIVFLFIGLINALNGVFFSYLYSLFIDPNLAFILGYMTSLIGSYLLNSLITFKESLSLIKFVKFCISYIPNFIIQNIIVLLFYNYLGWSKLLVYALAAALGMPITFLMVKLFALRKQK